MSSRVTPEHAGTIRRHYVESIDSGLSPSEIHRELRDEIFAQTGKYSIQEITATTSWIAGEILRGKRVNEINWNEGQDHTNEDADFDNIEKNAARDWQVRQLLAHTTLQQRQEMSYLLLPGKNEYDFEEFTKTGLRGENFLTYILGKHPKAVAQYIRNCRKYGVENRRVGSMNENFHREQVAIRGAYIDYFSQFCPDTSVDAYLLPLDPNHFPICVGFNFKKGREHRSTREKGSQIKEQKKYVDCNKDKLKNGADLVRLHFEAQAKTQNAVDGFEMSELRDQLIYDHMFINLGIAQQKNWPAPDLLKKFAKQGLANEDLDDLDLMEQYMRVRESLIDLIGIISLVDDVRSQLGIYISMAWAVGSVARAAVNSPVIRYLEQPFSYTSGESNMPFRSYFGVLETRKDIYQKHTDVMEFIFSLGTVLLEKVRDLNGQGAINIQDFLKISGVGSKKQLTVLRGSKAKPIAQINHDYLLEAQLELGAAGSSMTHHDAQSFESLQQNDMRILNEAKSMGSLEERAQKSTSSIIQNRKTTNSLQIGRNNLCPCGSGRKFKKCCLRNN